MPPLIVLSGRIKKKMQATFFKSQDKSAGVAIEMKRRRATNRPDKRCGWTGVKNEQAERKQTRVMMVMNTQKDRPVKDDNKDKQMEFTISATTKNNRTIKSLG